MEQREVTDSEGTIWVCVQAYAALEGDKAEKANSLTETSNKKVTVVCTPNGGAQTVRLKLSKSWMEDLSDDEINAKISAAK